MARLLQALAFASLSLQVASQQFKVSVKKSAWQCGGSMLAQRPERQPRFSILL